MLEILVTIWYLAPFCLLGLACLGSFFLFKRNYSILPFALIAGVGATLYTLQFGSYFPGEPFGAGAGIARGYPVRWLGNGISGFVAAPFNLLIDLLFWCAISFVTLSALRWIVGKTRVFRNNFVILVFTTFMLMLTPFLVPLFDSRVETVSAIQARLGHQQSNIPSENIPVPTKILTP
jgi:hypothetical protein